MQLIIAIVLAVLAGAGGGFLAGWQYGKTDCQVIAAKRATTAAVAQGKIRTNDAKQVAKLVQDDAARAAHFGGVRNELETKLQLDAGAADRECLPADVLRLVNEGRAGGVPANRSGADQGVPATPSAEGREGGDGRPGSGQ